MTKKYLKNEYFAAASAQDLFANFDDFYSQEACNKCGAIRDVYDELWKSSEELRTMGMSYIDLSFLAAQIGCEKAGL